MSVYKRAPTGTNVCNVKANIYDYVVYCVKSLDTDVMLSGIPPIRYKSSNTLKRLSLRLLLYIV